MEFLSMKLSILNGFIDEFHHFSNHLKNIFNGRNDNKLFTLWVSDNNCLPELQQVSLKSMLLTGHEVILYVYEDLENAPDGIKTADANEILDESNIFVYKKGFNKGSYSGFANWFRVKCLYETGSAWFDCDIISIKNITEINRYGPLISSQYNPDGGLGPNNAFLRLKKGDELLKYMLDYMEKVKDNVSHGDTGPSLLKSSMENKFIDYYKFLSNPNFIASIDYFHCMDFLKPSHEIIPSLNFDEIWGFHVWNAMFREKGYLNEKARHGLYYDLKSAVLNSSTSAEYDEKIRELIDYTG
jgi:hypothetical protein